MHVLEPELAWKEPGVQGRHDTLPMYERYPAPHTLHNVDEEAPVVARYLPSAQLSQLAAALLG